MLWPHHRGLEFTVQLVNLPNKHRARPEGMLTCSVEDPPWWSYILQLGPMSCKLHTLLKQWHQLGTKYWKTGACGDILPGNCKKQGLVVYHWVTGANIWSQVCIFLRLLLSTEQRWEKEGRKEEQGRCWECYQENGCEEQGIKKAQRGRMEREHKTVRWNEWYLMGEGHQQRRRGEGRRVKSDTVSQGPVRAWCAQQRVCNGYCDPLSRNVAKRSGVSGRAWWAPSSSVADTKNKN